MNVDVVGECPPYVQLSRCARMQESERNPLLFSWFTAQHSTRCPSRSLARVGEFVLILTQTWARLVNAPAYIVRVFSADFV